MTEQPEKRPRPRLGAVVTLLVLLVAAISIAIPLFQTKATVAIPDPVLKVALHEALNIPMTTPLTIDHLDGVDYLDLTHKTRIVDLTGLEVATSLRELHLTLREPNVEPVKSQVEALRLRGVKVTILGGLKSSIPSTKVEGPGE